MDEDEEEELNVEELEADEELNRELSKLLQVGTCCIGEGECFEEIEVQEDDLIEGIKEDPRLLAELEFLTNTREAKAVNQSPKQSEENERNEKVFFSSNSPPTKLPKPAIQDSCRLRSTAKIQQPQVVTHSHHVVISCSNNSPIKPFAQEKKEEVACSHMYLEKALREAKSKAMADAKRYLDVKNKKAGKESLDLAKYYQQELSVLESRKTLGPEYIALFHYETIRHEVKIENLDIAENELVLRVEGVIDLDKGAEGKSISIEYDLGLPRDDSIKGSLGATMYSQGKAEFSFERRLPIIKRGSAIKHTVQRKTTFASFTVNLHQGWLWSTKLELGIAKMPFCELLSKSICGGNIPILQSSKKHNGGESGRKKAKEEAIRGSVRAFVQIRSPLDIPEVLVTEERKLIVGKWPDPSPSIRVANEEKSSNKSPKIDFNCNTTFISRDVGNSSDSTDKALHTTRTPTAAAAASSFSTSTSSSSFSHSVDKVKESPFHISLLESFDVLNAEKEKVEVELNELRKTKSTSEEDESLEFEISCRLVMIRNKILILQNKVERGELSIDDYLESVKKRLELDKHLSRVLQDEGRNADAAAVDSRIEIMSNEIQMATEAV